MELPDVSPRVRSHRTRDVQRRPSSSHSLRQETCSHKPAHVIGDAAHRWGWEACKAAHPRTASVLFRLQVSLRDPEAPEEEGGEAEPDRGPWHPHVSLDASARGTARFPGLSGRCSIIPSSAVLVSLTQKHPGPGLGWPNREAPSRTLRREGPGADPGRTPPRAGTPWAPGWGEPGSSWDRSSAARGQEGLQGGRGRCSRQGQAFARDTGTDLPGARATG